MRSPAHYPPLARAPRIRDEAGGRTYFAEGEARAPAWVRVARSGDQVTGYVSDDGIVWQEVSSANIALTENIYVGLAVTSHNDGQINTSTFTDVSVR